MKVPIGTKIIVSVDDLPKGSRILVDVKCDNCFKKLSIPYAQYVSINHNKKYYCHSCAMKVLNSGELNPIYKSTLKEEDRIERRLIDGYIDFVKSVYIRDKYHCRLCNSKEKIVVHHLDGYNWCIEKRIDVNNGITLCEKCHKKFHSIYGNGNNTKEQFEEWINYKIDKLDDIIYKELPKARQVICIDDKMIFDSVYECARYYKYNKDSIYKCCNRKEKSISGKHFLWLDFYRTMSNDEIKKYFEWAGNNCFVKVVLLNTNKIYNSLTEAKRDYPNLYSQAITNCCKHITSYAGFDNNHVPLQWIYYDDYIKNNYIYYKNTEIKMQYIHLICLNSFEIFTSILNFSKKYHIGYASIEYKIKKIPNKYKVLNVKNIYFMHYYYFLELSDNEKKLLKKKYYNIV